MDITPSIANQKEKLAQEKATAEVTTFVEHANPSAATENVNARLENPLMNISHDRLAEMGRQFAIEKGLDTEVDFFAKGALVAQDPNAFESLPLLDDVDRSILRRELTKKWDHPKSLYFLVITCSIAAAAQGTDQSVTNGANLFWAPQFGLFTAPDAPNSSFNQWMLGFTAGAPYIACAVIGCWLTAPLNKALGRKGTIILASLLSSATSFWGAATNSWQHLLASRLVLGLAVGPVSATVPVYAAETAPPAIRGALVMQWQVWTAFGIMLGTAASLAFFRVHSDTITGLNWRLMLGTAGVPPLILMALLVFCPESPRWLISRGKYEQAYRSLVRLRHSKLQAARDLYFMHALLEEESTFTDRRSPIIELFAVPRNRRAALAAGILMVMQQFCGINAIAYYSSTIFLNSGLSELGALGATLGFGALNWIAAVPAIYTIDSFGRRNLLLVTFPLMAIFLFLAGLGFLIPDMKARTAVVALGIYLHCIAYSPGEGPVPFTYAAEAFPLYIRDIGMSFSTALTWGFNFVIALTFPRLLGAFTPTGAFFWYGVWNIIGFFLVLFFLPETKSLTLEELDLVFSVSTKQHAAYQWRHFLYNMRKYLLRQKVGPKETLYAWESVQQDEK